MVTYPVPIPTFWTTGTGFALQAALADPGYFPTGFSVTNALLRKRPVIPCEIGPGSWLTGAV
jgi:hypothetical protein